MGRVHLNECIRLNEDSQDQDQDQEQNVENKLGRNKKIRLGKKFSPDFVTYLLKGEP